MMAEQLLPCPFCGSQPEFASSGIEGRDLAKCPKCNDLAWISRWQTRTPSPATRAMIEWLKLWRSWLEGARFPDSPGPIFQAFLAEWPEPATPPAPEQPAPPSPWYCAICHAPVRIADDLRPWHQAGPGNHEAELSNEDLKILADGLRMSD